MADEKLHVGHRSRLRQQVTSNGLDGLHPHQVLEYILFQSVPRQDTSEMAHRLIDRFGSLEGVLNGESDELLRVQGIGRRSASWLKSLGDMSRFYQRNVYREEERVQSLKEAIRYFERVNANDQLGTWLMSLTTTGRVRCCRQVAPMAQWFMPWIIRDCMDDLLSLQANSAILAVFDPAGTADLISDNARQSAALESILSDMQITLIDVILFSPSDLVSMRRRGILGSMDAMFRPSPLAERYAREMTTE